METLCLFGKRQGKKFHSYLAVAKKTSDEGRIHEILYTLSFVLHFTVNTYLTRTDPKYSTRHTLNSCEEIPRASRFMCGNSPRGFYRCRGAARNSRGFRMNFAWILREF